MRLGIEPMTFRLRGERSRTTEPPLRLSLFVQL